MMPAKGFIEHSRDLHTSGFRWMEVRAADYWAMKDIEHADGMLWRYNRPHTQRQERSEK